MRKFVISDLHGNGNIYDSIMGYLDNIKKEDDVILYINGDLIDRGIDSARMLLDVKRRIESNENIIYLGGNHELLMYQYYKESKNHRVSIFNNWYDNGGFITNDLLYELLNDNMYEIDSVNEFVSNLDIYKLLDEKVNNKNIVLVHATCPYEVSENSNLKIKDDNFLVQTYVWNRKNNPFLQFKDKIGNKDYFTIIGHTPVDDIRGYKYYKDENYMNIDGGCACYVSGLFDYDHSALVEIKNNYLKILTFNNNNEIIYGNIFENNTSTKMSEEELNNEREYLNNRVITRKLIKNEDGVVFYK